MKISNDKLLTIFDKTMGRCHICRKQLCFSNYGAHGRRGAWEIDHSKPRARGGADHGNNLFAACTSCNRSKGKASSRTARARNGYKAAPYSKKKKVENAITRGLLGSAASILVPPQYKLLTALFGGFIGAKSGYNKEPK
jgi:5-methylcytosine-specific restriction endonuclease McrA